MQQQGVKANIMKNIVNILFLGLVFVLFACNSRMSKQENIAKKDVSTDSLKNKNDLQSTILASDTEQEENCIRETAKPIINKTVFPKATFNLQSDKLTGIETVDFDNGDRLIIKNWGCEYYVLTFCFETSRFQEDIRNYEYWFNKAVSLMMDIKRGINAPIDIEKGINALAGRCETSFRMHYESFKIGDEVDFGDEKIRSFVTIDRIEKINHKKYVVEVSFTTGPL